MGPEPRLGLLDLDLYPVGESSVPGVARVINLASNERAVPPSEAVIEAVRAAAALLNRYPDAGCAALRAAIGALHGLDPDGIVCGNGSSELIALLCAAYAGPGDEVLMGRYGYLFFETAARIAGAAPVKVPTKGLRFDVDAALAAVTPRTRLVLLDNPNNPTGTLLARHEVEGLRAGLRDDVLLVLDGAYAEYVADPDYEAGAALVEAGCNTVMLRTFSKIHGLAGIRLGWGYLPRPIADLLNRVRAPNNVSHLAQAAGLAALAEGDRAERYRAGNRRLREDFTRKSSALGLQAFPSEGSFLLLRFAAPGRDADAAYAFLKRRGIIARPMTAYGLDDCLRFTMGTDDEMTEALEALEAFQHGP